MQLDGTAVSENMCLITRSVTGVSLEVFCIVAFFLQLIYLLLLLLILKSITKAR